MFFYLPHDLESYYGLFSEEPSQTDNVASHKVTKMETAVFIIPAALNNFVFHPRNFIDLKEKLDIKRFWLIDYMRKTEALIQIIDHRNLSGFNPLTGRTPIEDRPRFPDVSSIYIKKSIDLPQCVANTVGPNRFGERSIPQESEVAALVGLCASYAGMEIIALGWNREEDVQGQKLKPFIQNRRTRKN